MSGKRPFWMHQAVEYVIGAVFVAQGVQSPTPIVPTVLGGVVMLNTACATGPLAAFRLVKPKLHRVLDWVVIGLIIVAAAQPFVSVESGTRLVMGGFAAVLGFVVWQSDFATKAPKVKKLKTPPVAPLPPPTRTQPQRPASFESTGDKVGRMAGRAAASGVNAYRKRKKS